MSAHSKNLGETRAIIFDMDGVIVDSEPLSDLHLLEFLVEIGQEPKSAQRNYQGLSIRPFIAQLIEEFKLNHDPETLAVEYRASYLAYLESLPALPEIPGVRKLIQFLGSSGCKLALGSSGSPKRIDMFMNKLDFKQYFPVIVTGDDVANSKPAPDCFLLAAERLKVAPADCVVIEDATFGVQAAKAAGMKCIAYAGSAHNTNDLSAADTIITDFNALVYSLRNNTLPV